MTVVEWYMIYWLEHVVYLYYNDEGEGYDVPSNTSVKSTRYIMGSWVCVSHICINLIHEVLRKENLKRFPIVYVLTFKL